MTETKVGRRDGEETAPTDATKLPRPATVRRRRRLAVTAVAGATTLTLAASALAGPTARAVRFGDRPSTVRVVVGLTGSGLTMGRVLPGNGDVFGTGTTSFLIAIGGSGTRVSSAYGLGVHVGLTAGTHGITVRVAAARSRFKYAQWTTLGSPSRLVIDLWKAAPPAPAAKILNDGCLRLTGIVRGAGSVLVSGRVVRPIFENQFAVIVRNAQGTIVARRPVTARVNTAWHLGLSYRVGITQVGTVEAFDDGGTGNVVCLVQQAVLLTPGR